MNSVSMGLEKARALVDQCLQDPEIKSLYEAGDEASRHQTKHDLQHAMEVLQLARQIATMVVARGTPRLTEWDTDVVVPLAAFLHDIGRAIDVDDHAIAGARWAKKYLSELTLPGDHETLPKHVINRVCKIIACHRSSVVMKAKVNDPAWAAVVIADKCVGDEERVRPWIARALSILTFFRLAWIPLRKGGVHDQINFAIKEVKLVNEDSRLVLKLKLDRRVCAPELVYTTYGERFLACHKAAAALGLEFALRFNGTRYSLDERKVWSVT